MLVWLFVQQFILENDLNLIKLLELFLKWIEKIQVGLLVALIELSGRLTLHL